MRKLSNIAKAGLFLIPPYTILLLGVLVLLVEREDREQARQQQQEDLRIISQEVSEVEGLLEPIFELHQIVQRHHPMKLGNWERLLAGEYFKLFTQLSQHGKLRQLEDWKQLGYQWASWTQTAAFLAVQDNYELFHKLPVSLFRAVSADRNPVTLISYALLLANSPTTDPDPWSDNLDWLAATHPTVVADVLQSFERMMVDQRGSKLQNRYSGIQFKAKDLLQKLVDPLTIIRERALWYALKNDNGPVRDKIAHFNYLRTRSCVTRTESPLDTRELFQDFQSRIDAYLQSLDLSLLDCG